MKNRLSAKRTAARKPQSGFTLIEVMVSILIFAFGLLGLAGLQARASQFSYDAEDRMRASIMANEIVSQMWVAGTTSLPSATITAWNTRLATPTVSGLPSGAGTITTDGTGLTTITITWASPTHNGTYLTQFILTPST